MFERMLVACLKGLYIFLYVAVTLFTQSFFELDEPPTDSDKVKWSLVRDQWSPDTPMTLPFQRHDIHIYIYIGTTDTVPSVGFQAFVGQSMWVKVCNFRDFALCNPLSPHFLQDWFLQEGAHEAW